MRKSGVVFASVVLLGAVTLAPPVAGAHEGAPDDELTLYGVVTDFDREDHGKDGFGEGDVLKVSSDLFDEDGADAGKSRSACEVTEYDDGGEVHAHHDGENHHENIEFAADCRAGFKLDDGAILAAGQITEEDLDDGVFTFDIKKGNGDFEDAEGTVDVEFLYEEGHTHAHDVAAMHAGEDHGDGDHAEGEDHGHEAPRFKLTFHFEG